MTDQKAIAHIINGQWDRILERCNKYEIRCLDAIRRCRTPSLGGHLYQCDKCGKLHHRYNSKRRGRLCRNRHCPVCQNTQKEEWIAARESQLLPTKYYHIVFTVPHALNGIFLGYKREMYAMLFRCAWRTLDEFGWNQKYLGTQIGTTMVLHTWGSNLSYHPHVHCIVPGGGVTFNNKWKEAKGNGKFLFPVKALSKVFRGKFVNDLKRFLASSGMEYTSELNAQLYAKPWIVYAKRPFGGARGVIKYLARYTHKTAISNHRIIKYDNDSVTFSYKDYRHNNQQKVMTLDAWEFVRRFVLHLLPKRFTRIRHYGILSSQWKKKLFEQKIPMKARTWKEIWESKGLHVDRCAYCKKGKLIHLSEIKPNKGPPNYRNFSKDKASHSSHAIALA